MICRRSRRHLFSVIAFSLIALMIRTSASAQDARPGVSRPSASGTVLSTAAKHGMVVAQEKLAVPIDVDADDRRRLAGLIAGGPNDIRDHVVKLVERI